MRDILSNRKNAPMNQDTKTKEKLLTEFPASTAEEWREAAEKLLKGKPFDKVMTQQTPEGIRLEPIFRKEVLDTLSAVETLPGFDGYLRGTDAAGYKNEPWEIAQELPYGTASEFNAAARADLMRGQNSLNVILDIATLKGLDPDTAKAGRVSSRPTPLDECLASYFRVWPHPVAHSRQTMAPKPNQSPHQTCCRVLRRTSDN